MIESDLGGVERTEPRSIRQLSAELTGQAQELVSLPARCGTKGATNSSRRWTPAERDGLNCKEICVSFALGFALTVDQPPAACPDATAPNGKTESSSESNSFDCCDRDIETNGFVAAEHMRILGRIGVPAEVAQLVEQWSEEPCVASSILALGTEWFPSEFEKGVRPR
jgi:hypothetical protein